MSLVCYDDIYATALPAGADAYLGYVDGHWPDFNDEVAKFTSAHIIGLTVFDIQQGNGCDVESGDLEVSQSGSWSSGALARGVNRPIVYASISLMAGVLENLTAAGLARTSFRLLSAHYGLGNHICGPTTCKYPGAPAVDGTQWTDNAVGLGGVMIDQSALEDNFFDGDPALPGTPAQPVPAGPGVPPSRRNIYTPVAVDGIFGSKTCAALQFVIFAGNIADVDGFFGPLSKKQLQRYLTVQPDGIVGPLTVRAVQQRVGAKQDGIWGPLTTKALQNALNAGLF